MRFLRSSADRGANGHSRKLFVIARCLPFVALVAVVTIELSPVHVVYTGPLLSRPRPWRR
ncbi:hypothetical protein SAZ11_05790 [Streptomyces sp. FXJ1.4098]|nr:hypothetical protein [Streptomyces sp. FXJ1.4098]